MSGITRKPVFLTFLCGVLVLIAGAATRFYYFSEYQPVDAPGLQAWQVQGSTPTSQSPDLTETDHLVNHLKQHGYLDGFIARTPLGPDKEEATAHQAPLFPMFRAAVELGAEQLKDYAEISSPAALRWVHLLLGSLTCLLYYIITLRGFGRNHFLALVVGLATAAYPFWIINTGELEDGVLVTFLLAWALSLAIGLGQKGGVIRSVLFGLVLAALALTRASLLPLVIVFQLWFFLRCRYVSHGWLCGILTLASFAAGLTPWLLHCYQQFKTPVPVVTSAWLHLWIGNNVDSNGGEYQWRMKNKLDKDLVKKLESTQQAERYTMLAETVLQNMVENPVETFKRRVRAGLQFFLGSNNLSGAASFWPGNKTMTPPEWLRPVMLISMMGMYALVVLGWRWSYGWKFASAPVSLVIYWLPIPYFLSHADAMHTSRLPMDGVLILLAVIGLVAWIPFVGGKLLRGEETGNA